MGPASVLFTRLPHGAESVVVIDNTALGPAIGGVRMSSSVSPTEVARLARAMTVKNAVAGLPHGGAKTGINVPVVLDAAAREGVIRAFARAIEHLVAYIPGPDMGTDETAMAWVRDEIGRAAGLPALLGAIPLNELGATGSRARGVPRRRCRTRASSSSTAPGSSCRDSGLSGGVTVDLVGQALTEIGSLRVDLGVGDVAVSVPEDMRVRVDSQVGVGRIAVDGRTVDSGFGLRWSEPQRMSETVVVDVRVGMGAIEVRHG